MPPWFPNLGQKSRVQSLTKAKLCNLNCCCNNGCCQLQNKNSTEKIPEYVTKKISNFLYIYTKSNPSEAAGWYEKLTSSFLKRTASVVCSDPHPFPQCLLHSPGPSCNAATTSLPVAAIMNTKSCMRF